MSNVMYYMQLNSVVKMSCNLEFRSWMGMKLKC